MKKANYVQYGCGDEAPKEWKNFDVSPTLRIQQTPIIGRLFRSKLNLVFPDNVYYGDILLLGIGTNNYINYVEENYSFLPGFMRWGIHGEFQRVTVENGIVGLFLYLYNQSKIQFHLNCQFLLPANFCRFFLMSKYQMHLK